MHGKTSIFWQTFLNLKFARDILIVVKTSINDIKSMF